MFKMNKMFDIREVEKLPKLMTKKEVEKELLKHMDTTPLDQHRSYLCEEVVKLRMNNEKLSLKLAKTELVHKEINCHLTKDDLSRFFDLGECDQKLMAHLFWEDLTKDMKNVFMDKHFMEDEKHIQKQINERMTDPVKMRQHFLKGAAPILNDVIAMAKSDKKSPANPFAFTEVWEVLRGIITSASNPVPLIDLKGKTISDQIDEILTQVTEQKITFVEAKELMSLVSSGFNLQELPKLMAKLEQLEN